MGYKKTIKRKQYNKKKKGGQSGLDYLNNDIYKNITCDAVIKQKSDNYPQGIEVPEDKEFKDILHWQYQKCCPKNLIGMKNSSSVCKQIKNDFDNIVNNRNNDDDEYEVDEDKYFLLKTTDNLNKIDCKTTNPNRLTKQSYLNKYNDECCVNSSKWWVGKYFGRKNPSQKCKETRKRIKDLNNLEQNIEIEKKKSEEIEKEKQEFEERPTIVVNPVKPEIYNKINTEDNDTDSLTDSSEDDNIKTTGGKSTRRRKNKKNKKGKTKKNKSKRRKNRK